MVCAFSKIMLDTPDHVGATPVPFDFRNCPDVPELFVELTLYPAGYVTNTSFVPAENDTKEPELEEDKTVSLDKTVPDAVYVPTPTSHSLPDCPAIV
jgi:hypothetical protein